MLVIPLQTPTINTLFIVLEDANIERVKAHDPAEVSLRKLPDPLGRIDFAEIQICYASPEDVKQLQGLFQIGDILGALKLLTRGWKYRPDADHDRPYVSALPEKPPLN